jgi:hypothetical protein
MREQDDEDNDEGSDHRKDPGAAAAKRECRARVRNVVQREDFTEERTLLAEAQSADYFKLDELINGADSKRDDSQ